MWTGRGTSTSPGIKEEKVVQGVVAPPSDMANTTTITPALTQSPPNQTSSPSTLATLTTTLNQISQGWENSKPYHKNCKWFFNSWDPRICLF